MIFICLLAEYDFNHGEMFVHKVGLFNNIDECHEAYE